MRVAPKITGLSIPMQGLRALADLECPQFHWVTLQGRPVYHDEL
jgi:hypothetical protein